jgi:hypothetical protein
MTIRALYIDREALDVRSSGDNRRRVDAYFVVFSCPPDDINPGHHEWVKRFECERGHAFKMSDFQDKAAAHLASNYTRVNP